MKDIRSIIDELDSFVPEHSKHALLESRAQHVLSSSMHLLEMIYQNFTLDEAEDLHKKLLNAIKMRDPKKFTNKIRTIRDSK